MIYHLTFLRHGESESNWADRLQGQSESALTETGRLQAQHIATHWKAEQVRFDTIIASPLRRARQTAEILASILGLDVELDPIWKERYFGALEGMTYEAIHQEYPEIDYFLPFEAIGGNGESQLDLYLRACQGLQGLLRRPAGRYLVVTHGAMLGKILFAIFGITPQGHYQSPLFRFGNTAYVNFTYEPDRRQWSMLAFHNLQEWAGLEDGK